MKCLSDICGKIRYLTPVMPSKWYTLSNMSHLLNGCQVSPFPPLFYELHKGTFKKVNLHYIYWILSIFSETSLYLPIHIPLQKALPVYISPKPLVYSCLLLQKIQFIFIFSAVWSLNRFHYLWGQHCNWEILATSEDLIVLDVIISFKYILKKIGALLGKLLLKHVALYLNIYLYKLIS